MEQGVAVVVEMEVEEIELELGCMEASTLGMVHSTEVVEEHMAEMVGFHIGNGIEVQKTREKVWTMKNQQEGTKGGMDVF